MSVAFQLREYQGRIIQNTTEQRLHAVTTTLSINNNDYTPPLSPTPYLIRVMVYNKEEQYSYSVIIKIMIKN